MGTTVTILPIDARQASNILTRQGNATVSRRNQSLRRKTVHKWKRYEVAERKTGKNAPWQEVQRFQSSSTGEQRCSPNPGPEREIIEIGSRGRNPTRSIENSILRSTDRPQKLISGTRLARNTRPRETTVVAAYYIIGESRRECARRPASQPAGGAERRVGVDEGGRMFDNKPLAAATGPEGSSADKLFTSVRIWKNGKARVFRCGNRSAALLEVTPTNRFVRQIQIKMILAGCVFGVGGRRGPQLDNGNLDESETCHARCLIKSRSDRGNERENQNESCRTLERFVTTSAITFPQALFYSLIAGVPTGTC